MTIQLSVRARNARLESVEASMGAGPTLRLRSGAPPANTAAARSGTIIATLVLPADFMADAANGAKALAGVWQDLAADNAGTIGHFEIEGTGAVIDMQGTVTATGGGGDLEVNNTVVNQGQQIDITAFTWNDPNG